MSERGITVMVTTHVMDEAEKCHELAMMRDGRLIARGTPAQLRESIGASSLEEAFIHYGSGAPEGEYKHAD
jgi:ABC-2 type transport system ATP-binding protein